MLSSKFQLSILATSFSSVGFWARVSYVRAILADSLCFSWLIMYRRTKTGLLLNADFDRKNPTKDKSKRAEYRGANVQKVTN